MTVQDVIDELKRFDPHTECRIDGMEIDYIHQTQTGYEWNSRITKTIVDITRNRPKQRISDSDIQKYVESCRP